jgi:hypothetical protein
MTKGYLLSVKIHPAAYEIKLVVKGNTMTDTLSEPCKKYPV